MKEAAVSLESARRRRCSAPTPARPVVGDAADEWAASRFAVQVKALELAEAGGAVGVFEVMGAHTHPVVEPLQGEVQVFVGLELDDCEAAVTGDAEQVEHAAVAGRECRHLGVDVVGIEVGVEHRHIAAQHALEPALGLHAEEGVALAAAGLAAQEEEAHALAELAVRAPRMKRDQIVIVNISGRGDKDMEMLAKFA